MWHFYSALSYIIRWPIHIGLPMYIPGEGSLIGGLDISMYFMSLMHEKTFASSLWTIEMSSAAVFALFHASQGVSAGATSRLQSPFPIRLKWSATITLRLAEMQSGYRCCILDRAETCRHRAEPAALQHKCSRFNLSIYLSYYTPLHTLFSPSRNTAIAV